MFNIYNSIFNRVTKQDVSDVNFPSRRERFVYSRHFSQGLSWIRDGLAVALEVCSCFRRRAIGLRSRPIAMISILEQLCLHGSGCDAFRDLAGSSGFAPKKAAGRHRYLCAPSHETHLLPFHHSLPCGSVASASGSMRKRYYTAWLRKLTKTSGLSLMAKTLLSHDGTCGSRSKSDSLTVL